MAEQPQLLPLDAGTQLPGALDHAWVVERMDQQHSFNEEGTSLWTVRVRCVYCRQRVDFRAAGVPPCRPQGAPEARP